MTAASVAVSDAWQEKCLIGIALPGGTDIQFEGLTENVKISPGAKDAGQVVLVNGGRVVTYSPEDMFEVTIKGWPYEAGTPTGTTASGFFDLKHAGPLVSGTAQPLAINPSFDRVKYRVIVLWVESSTVTTPQGAVASGRALRFIGANLYCTNVEPDEFGGDSPLSCTVTFKAASFDKAADGNYVWGSTDDSITLPAVAAYTTSAKGF